jgi:tRNA(adenine34) deaminase
MELIPVGRLDKIQRLPYLKPVQGFHPEADILEGKVMRVEEDKKYMTLALREAGKAAARGEVPVGAVIVERGTVVARGFNRKESSHDPTAHAEMAAIRRAAKKLGRWRLTGATLYVTLEPCAMCMGAIIQARIPSLVFAAFDPKAGACGSLFDLSDDRRLNHRVRVSTGVLEEESSVMLKDFFSALRRGGRRHGPSAGKKGN